MEEEKYGFSWEEEVKQAVQKFERMTRNNESYFFDVIEFESIIDYYIESNNSRKSIRSSGSCNKAASQFSVYSAAEGQGASRQGSGRGKHYGFLKQLENIEPGNHEIYIAKGTAMGMLGDIQGAKRMFDSTAFAHAAPRWQSARSRHKASHRR